MLASNGMIAMHGWKSRQHPANVEEERETVRGESEERKGEREEERNHKP